MGAFAIGWQLFVVVVHLLPFQNLLVQLTYYYTHITLLCPKNQIFVHMCQCPGGRT